MYATYELNFLNINLSNQEIESRKHGVAAYIREACKYNVIEYSVSNILVIFLCTYNVYLIFLYGPPLYDLAQNNSLINFVNFVQKER